MVYISNRYKPRESRFHWKLLSVVTGTVLFVLFSRSAMTTTTSSSSSITEDRPVSADIRREEGRLRAERVHYDGTRPTTVFAPFDESIFVARAAQRKEYLASRASRFEPNDGHECPYVHLTDLSDTERHPVATKTRYMVDPPKGGKLQLVCCHTTAGSMSIAVHHKWAPLGAERFVSMVESGYFNDERGAVPFMRCISGFLCQFGLNSDPAKTKGYGTTIPDDPNWLPEGPHHRENSDGVKRFAKGYLAYAGAGKNSRDNQLIMALEDTGPLAGGSPWEVPWGELVGAESFKTLDKIHTDYGEKGPGQGKLHNVGMTDDLRKEFPLIDYITWCGVVDEVDDGDVGPDVGATT